MGALALAPGPGSTGTGTGGGWGEVPARGVGALTFLGRGIRVFGFLSRPDSPWAAHWCVRLPTGALVGPDRPLQHLAGQGGQGIRPQLNTPTPERVPQHFSGWAVQPPARRICIIWLKFDRHILAWWESKPTLQGGTWLVLTGKCVWFNC